jgi:hypothetical protein
MRGYELHGTAADYGFLSVAAESLATMFGHENGSSVFSLKADRLMNIADINAT